MSRTLGLAMRLRRLALPGLTTLALTLSVGAVELPASARIHPTATFVIDGVKVAASGAELQGTVLSSNAGDATQETTFLDLGHRRVISVIAAPFGTRPATEDALPFARRSGAQAYRQALHDYRSRGGEFAFDAPPIHLFGRLIQGEVGSRTEHLTTASGREVNRDVFTVEWVTEAGPRLWIVRARQFEPAGHGMADVYDFSNSLSGLTIWAEGSLSAPTTIAPDTVDGVAARPSGSPDQSQDRRPPTYSSGCDTENYDRLTGRAEDPTGEIVWAQRSAEFRPAAHARRSVRRSYPRGSSKRRPLPCSSSTPWSSASAGCSSASAPRRWPGTAISY